MAARISSGDIFRLAVCVFLVTLASLMTELALTRVFSVLLWYHFAFLVISLALVGLSAGAIGVYLVSGRSGAAEDVPGGGRDAVAWLAVASALAAAASVTLLAMLRMDEEISAAMLGKIVLACVASAVPFAAIGATTSLAIRRVPHRVSLLYGADLLGAAAGCLLYVPVAAAAGAPLVVLVAAGTCAVAALLVAHRRRVQVTAAIVLLALIGLAAVMQSSGRFDLRYAKGRARDLADIRWNAFSRVAVWKHDQQESFTRGISSRYNEVPALEEYAIDIDAGANTPLLRKPRDPSELEFLRYDLTSLPFSLVTPTDTLVIGPGGGRDVVMALEHGAEHVTAVEINPDIVDLVRNKYGEYTGHLYSRPDVEVIVRDGRSFVLADRRQYDLIMLSLVDTFAASAAGAMSLSENLLYTTDALEDYFERLKPGGVVSFTRWVWEPDRETIRLVSVAREVLARRGVAEPERHIAVVSQRNLGAVMISKSPLSDAQVQRLRERVEALDFVPLHLPGEQLDTPMSGLARTDDPDAFIARYPFDISATTDNRPFFFFTLRLRDVARVLSMPGGRSQNIGVLVLLLVAAVVTVMAVLFTLVPLWVAHRRGGPPTGAAGGEVRVRWGPLIVYFIGLGVGFMLIEIPLLQHFILVTGHPSASLSVVLFSLLLGGGLGSLWTGRWPHDGRSTTRRLTIMFIIIVALLAAISFGTPRALPIVAAWPMAARAALAAAAMLPMGFCLGTFFPSGLRLLGDRGDLLPWAIALNAVASVLGSVTAMILGIAGGFAIAMACGVGVYVIALLAVRKLAQAPVAIPAPSLA